MTTETVTISYAALPAYLGLRPSLPLYHERYVSQGSHAAPAVPLRVLEAYLPAGAAPAYLAYIEEMARTQTQADRLDIYLVTDVPAEATP